MKRTSSALALLWAAGLAAVSQFAGAQAIEEAASPSILRFDLVRSETALSAGCLADAGGQVRVVSIGDNELMSIVLTGLPPDTEFDVFVTQLPDAPFGLSWYQGDIETNGDGRGRETFIGRFNIETFIVAPGVGPAPVVHSDLPFPDEADNPAFDPIHTFHIGVWFDSPEDAAAAGCPGAVTPFNGEHNAGVQILSTRNFPDQAGPLIELD